MTSYRLTQGGLIDRSLSVPFSYNGERYQGHPGDTLASAMLANGIQLVGRSFKLHRPRGVMGTGPEEPNALFTLGEGQAQESNLRSTMVDLYEGLEAWSQNAWPSPNFDLMAVNSWLTPFLPAGFYYKIFMGSANFWMWPEWFIRRAAGLGRIAPEDNRDDFQHHYSHTDVLVVGGGPSGLAAALAAAQTGASVTLVEERSRLGGQGLWRGDVDGLTETIAQLEAMPKVRLLTRCTAWGHYDDNMLGCVQIEGNPGQDMPAHKPRARAWHIRAKRVIYATGAIERPLVFANNDRPGVMLAHAGPAYAHQFGVMLGKRLVLATNNDDAYSYAGALADVGAEIILCDARNQIRPELQSLVAGKLDLRLGKTVVAARGGKAVTGAEIAGLDGRNSQVVACDAVLSSGGWSPAIHLHCHTGGKAEWRDDIQAFVAGRRMQSGLCVGAAAGLFDNAACLYSGWQQGQAAAQELGYSGASQPPSGAEPLSRYSIQALWSNPKSKRIKGKAFVDFQNDAASSDVGLANREGYRSVEHLKRYTTLGMGTDQGKTSNINGHALLAQAQGRSIPETGTTTFRPPYTPLQLGAFAGPHVLLDFSPIRRTPMHAWHKDHGASFVEAGAWYRPEWYTRDGEDMWTSIKREARNVRQSAGLCDVSTLGKIDVQGPDALEFIQRLYCNGMKTLPVGKVRYGLMLREDGFVMDDGTIARLAEHHYYMTTTTANAAKVLAVMEYYLDVVWPDLNVRVTSLTDQWAAMSLAGPKARQVLAAVFPNEDVSNEALPFMGWMDATLDGVPVRLLRISFSGELAYELHTPAHFGLKVWQTVIDKGTAFGLMPYGTEALGALRVEKGHVAGSELDGRTTPDDLGLGKMVAGKKDFIGRLALEREGLKNPNRRKLVGLIPADGKSRVIAGSRLTEAAKVGEPDLVSEDLGWISSAHYSVELDTFVGLGFLQDGPQRRGQTLYAASPVEGQHILMTVVSPHMVDPSGERHYA